MIPGYFFFIQHGYKLVISRYEKGVINIETTTIAIIKDILLPVVLMLAGWLYGRYSKIMDAKNETIRTLSNHVDDLEDGNLDSRLEEVESNIEDLQKRFSESINAFTNAMDQIKILIDEIKEDQVHLTRASQLNGKYTHELAILLMTLSEGIRDQHLDGNITRAIVRYRKFEQEVLGDIVAKGGDVNISDR